MRNASPRHTCPSTLIRHGRKWKHDKIYWQIDEVNVLARPPSTTNFSWLTVMHRCCHWAIRVNNFLHNFSSTLFFSSQTHFVSILFHIIVAVSSSCVFVTFANHKMQYCRFGDQTNVPVSRLHSQLSHLELVNKRKWSFDGCDRPPAMWMRWIDSNLF